MNDVILKLTDVHFSYRSAKVTSGSSGDFNSDDHGSSGILNGVNLQIRRGEMVALQGPSGSGKSTLFYLLGCMLKPSSGTITVAGSDLDHLTDEQLATFRNQTIGFIFQQFHLLPRATVLQNILLPASYPAEISKVGPQDIEKARTLAQTLGLSDHLEKQPNELSGGQQQRVAIARALMRDVDLILADEPTGNLDSRNAEQVLTLLRDLNRSGKTVILITHDQTVADACERIIHLRDGHVEGELVPSPANALADAASGSVQVARPATPAPRNIDDRSSEDWAMTRVFWTSLPHVWRNISRNRMKSLLTMIGVIVGVASVLAMLSLARFTKNRILEGYEALGANKIQLNGGRNWLSNAREAKGTAIFFGFTEAGDIGALTKTFPEITRISPVKMLWDAKLAYGGKSVSDKINILGVNEQYLKITNGKLDAGMSILPHHVDEKNRVCVVGHDIPKKLEKSSDDLLGQFINMSLSGRYPFTCKVIGILSSQRSNNEWFQPDRQILIPSTFALTMSDSWQPSYSQIVLTVADVQYVEEMGVKLKNFFTQKYGDSGEFYAGTDAVLVAQMKRFLNIFTLLLGSIAFLSLFVGGVGIHNMMLVSVSDRLKEIGLRKALGATSKSIKILFLAESILLCFCAGFIGILIGWGACQLGIYAGTKFVKDMKFEWVTDPWALIISLGSIVAVGIFSGLKPAAKAERLSVIEALRSE
jgi:macrolide transport system ATP-binding/permease protein